jgi:hypothetical protein
VGRQTFRGAHRIAFLGPQGVELTKSFLTCLLSKRIVGISLVKLILFLLQLSAVLEHRCNLLAVKEAVGLAARE